ncbi:MAG: class I SAM-dependent methyltransferase [Syntrophomonadaceae bacterium]|nr:class I SAM-dependent methyltransferase [Syntrophomonadaceae bacterium]
MSIEEIREKWRQRQTNIQASIDMWNSRAERFGEFILPEAKDNSFLRLLEEKNMLGPEKLVLDVGCGAGKYALAIAPSCRHITGVDLSPEMIGIARKKTVEYHIENVDFFVEDWHQLDIEKTGYTNKFDLVFAHMTPAVQSAESFEKLSAASRGWCVLSKPVRRTDPVSDKVKELVGIKERRESADNDILFAFQLLWLQGYLPQLEYEKKIWNLQQTLEEAYGLYVNRIKTYRDITEAEEEKVKAYLRSLVRDGFIYEDTDTTIATLYWQAGS